MRPHLLFAFSLFLTMPLLAFVPITRILIKGVARDTQISEIRRALGFAEGDIFDENLVLAAQKRLESATILHDVKLSSRHTPEGAEVTVAVVMEPILEEVVIVAPDALTRLLSARLSLLKGEHCSEQQVAKALEEAREAAVQRGFLKVALTPELTRNDKGDWNLRVIAKEYEPTRIAHLSIKADNARIESEIRNALSVVEGSIYQPASIKEALKTWRDAHVAKGHFDAHFKLNEVNYDDTANTTDIVIEASAAANYRIHFEGVIYFSARFVREEMTRLLVKSEADSSRKQRLLVLLHSLYKRHGFNDVKIDINENLFVRVVEGPQYKVSELLVRGASKEEDEDLALRLRTIIEHNYKSESINDPALVVTDGFFVFDERAVNKAKAEIVEELHQKGYLGAKLSGPKVKIDTKTHFVSLTFNAAIGTRSHISSIEIDAYGFSSKESFLACVDFKTGDALVLSNVEGPRSCMEEYLWNNGYPYAQVQSETVLSEQNSRALVKFKVRSGPFVSIESIIIRGLVTTKPSTLSTRVSVAQGEPFSLARIGATRQALFNSDIVDKAEIFTESSVSDESKRTLVIHVHEKARTSIEVGAGLSLEDGPRVSTLATQRNLFGLGMSVKGRLQLNYPALFYRLPFLYTPKDQEALESRFKEESPFIRALLYTEAKVSLGVEYPYFLTSPWPTDAMVGLAFNRELKVAYTLNRLGIESGLTMKPFSSFRFSPHAQYEFAKFFCPSGYKEGLGCGDGDQADPATRRIDSGVTQQFTLRLFGSLDGRDSTQRPKKGYLFDASVDLGLGQADLGNDESSRLRPIRYLKLQASANVFRPLSKSATWHLSMKVGHIFELANDDYVPLFKRFYLGGTNSIRGFAEDRILPADDPNWPADSFSPKDPRSLSISLGGNFFALMRGEIRFPFTSEHDGAVFIDAGELLQNAGNFSLSSLAVGAGFGIRYVTPIGPLMFDLGIRIVDGVRSYNSGFWQLFGIHFSIGYF